MSTGQADREILFTLRPEVADNADEAFDRLASAAERTNSRIVKSAKTAADQWLAAWEANYQRLSVVVSLVGCEVADASSLDLLS